MGNRLTKIYTRTGDDGTTGLGNGERVAKDCPRVEAYGTVDELNACVGLILATRDCRRWSGRASPGSSIACSTWAGTGRARPRRHPRRGQHRPRAGAGRTQHGTAAAEGFRASRRRPRRRRPVIWPVPCAGAPSAASSPRADRSGQPGIGALPEPAVGPAVCHVAGAVPYRRRQRGAVAGTAEVAGTASP